VIPNSDWRKKLNLWDLTTPRGFHPDLVEWVKSRPEASFYDLWEETIDPTWLPYLAQSGGATKKDLILAACGVVRLCLHLLPPRDGLIAIETAESWARKVATEGQLHKALYAVPVPTDTSSPAYPAYNAVSIACNASAYSDSYLAAACATSDTVYWALRAGNESQVICSTLRKHLNFERPREKGLTVWQRLAAKD